MKAGIYKVEFKTQLGSGTGVIVKTGNSIKGEDTGMYYTGVFEPIDENTFEIKVRVRRHSNHAGMFSTLGEGNENLILKGTEGDLITATGYVVESPKIQFEAFLNLLE